MYDDDKIKITKNLIFDYNDLMKDVDFSQEFTLRDILTICVRSKIPIKNLCLLLRCSYIPDYYAEVLSNPFESDSELDYLEVYWWGTKSSYEGEVKPKGIKDYGSMWCFHGIGKLGYVPSDVLEYGNITEEEKKNFRQPISVEFSPTYKLADYPIKIGNKMHITDYDADPKTMLDSGVDFQPSITLIELLHAIFYELSFLGNPKQRDEKIDGLNKMVEDIKSGKMKTYSSEEVFKRIKKKLNKKIKKTKEGKK